VVVVEVLLILIPYINK